MSLRGIVDACLMAGRYCQRCSYVDDSRFDSCTVTLSCFSHAQRSCGICTLKITPMAQSSPRYISHFPSSLLLCPRNPPGPSRGFVPQSSSPAQPHRSLCLQERLPRLFHIAFAFITIGPTARHLFLLSAGQPRELILYFDLVRRQFAVEDRRAAPS